MTNCHPFENDTRPRLAIERKSREFARPRLGQNAARRKTCTEIHLECGGLTPLSFFLSFFAVEFPKKKRKKAASNPPHSKVGQYTPHDHCHRQIKLSILPIFSVFIISSMEKYRL